MKKETRKSRADRVALFGLLTALSLVLGWLDRAVPLSALLGGAVPGIKLGLANTVLLYAVYMMDWRASLLLMLVKVLLSGFLFGSPSAMLFSLAGGTLSLLVMLGIRKRPAPAALLISLISLASASALFLRGRPLQGSLLWCAVLIVLAAFFALAAFFVIRRHPEEGILGTSLAGAVAHNLGQVLVSSAVLRTPQLLYTYLPILAGVGAAVGCLTGVVARRVFRALHRIPDGGAAPRR